MLIAFPSCVWEDMFHCKPSWLFNPADKLLDPLDPYSLSWFVKPIGTLKEDGQDANGFPYTTPYNSGASSSSNAKLALAAEGASRDNATNTTFQNLRTWSCEMNPTTGLKVKGSAQPR